MVDFKTIYDRDVQPYHKGNYWKRYLLSSKKHKSVVFSPEEIAQITEFINWKTVTSGVSDSRKVECVAHIRMFKRYYAGELSDITKSDWYETVTSINQDSKYSINTRSHIVIIIKMLYVYLIKHKYANNLELSDVYDVKPLSIPATVKRPEDLPTKEQIHTITSDPTCSVMYSALINTIYYTGGRVAEILRLNWGDIVFQNQFVKVTITDTKTNKIRYIPCVQALPFLAAWRRQYPTSIVGGPENNNPVFVTKTDNGYKRLQYATARALWNRLQSRSGIHPSNGKRYFGFHSLRAAHITNLAAANVPDAVIRDIAWGNQNTQMMSHYLLLSDKTKEDLILQSAGIETEDTSIKENAIVLCPKCHAPNGPRDRYCRFCGQSLTQSAQNTQELLNDASSSKKIDIIGVLARDLGISKDILKEKLLKSL